MNTAIYLVKAVILITAGVTIANLVLESSLMRRLSVLITPFCRASNLPKECVFSLVAAFFNPTAGKSALAGFYRNGRISETETTLTAVMSTFPIVVGESLFRVQAPIALVLLGPFVGGIYIFLNLFSSFLQSFAAFLYSKSHFPAQPEAKKKAEIEAGAEAEVEPKSERMRRALKKSFGSLKKVIPITVVAFLVVDLLFRSEIINYIGLLFDPALRVLGLPGESVTVLIADLAHFSAGYATVAALLANGVVTAKQAVLTLLVGSLLIITLIYLKFSLSMYISLFGRLGVKISVVNYLSSLLSKVVVILLVLILM
ncbi:MAG: nucleoside recognition protein [Candidatus Methanophagaceae archaeon]|nr:MAG: nucleoside recognition protein [Methanophagales archaeon]